MAKGTGKGCNARPIPERIEFARGGEAVGDSGFQERRRPSGFAGLGRIGRLRPKIRGFRNAVSGQEAVGRNGSATNLVIRRQNIVKYRLF